MTFSEFGRRVEQNASGRNRDHGAAAPMFVIGSHVQAGLIGKHPPPETTSDQETLKYQIDFAASMRPVLQGWLDAPSKPVLGQQ